MIFSKDIETDDVIVEALSRGEMRVKELHKEVTKKREVSLKSIYNALNRLVDTGVVYKRSVNVGLSREWVAKVEEHLSGPGHAPELESGQSVTYTLSSIHDSDRYWKHLTLLIRGEEKDYPVFFLFPNELWIHLDTRGESEREYLRSFEKSGHYGFLTLGGSTDLDTKFRKEYMSDFLQIECVPHLLKKKNIYTTIIGDYIIRTHIPEDAARGVNQLYATETDEEELARKLNLIFAKPHKIKLQLAKRPEQARQWRKRLSRPFYVPLDLQKKYSLFTDKEK